MLYSRSLELIVSNEIHVCPHGCFLSIQKTPGKWNGSIRSFQHFNNGMGLTSSTDTKLLAGLV